MFITRRTVFSNIFGFFLIFIISTRILCANMKRNTFNPVEPWNLPIIPDDLDDMISKETRYAKPDGIKKIPSNFWINFREIPPERVFNDYYLHLTLMFDRAPNWTIIFMDEHRRDFFMEKYYSDSSIFWAYSQIDTIARVAASDIWRYCALYAFGGLYLDDDAYLGEPLDKMVRPNDTLLLAFEGNRFIECYNESYFLSDHQLRQTYNDSVYPRVKGYSNHNLVQWGILAAPKHPIFLRLIENVVDVIKHEYFRNSVVLSIYQHNWHIVMCTTGPRIFALTVKNELLKIEATQNVTDDFVRFYDQDFWDVGGTYKVRKFRAYSSTPIQHGEWRNKLDAKDAMFLKGYAT